MYFQEELNPSAVEKIGDSYSGNKKAVLFCIAGLAIGFVLYKVWKSLNLKESTADQEFYSLLPSNAPRKIKILVVGLKETGKTSFARKFCKRRGCGPAKETAFGQYMKQHSVNVGDLSIDMWDVCGAGQNPEIWHDIFDLEELDFIIFCVDSSEPTKFVEARKALHTFLRIKVFKKTPLILVATKQDKADAVDPYSLYLTMNLENFQGTRPIHTTGIQLSSYGQSKGFMDLYNLLATIDTRK